jgi:molecular chaperone GrpE
MEGTEKNTNIEVNEQEAVEQNQTQQSEESMVRDADFSALEGVGTVKGASFATTAEIAALKAEAEANKDKYLRTLADFENFKKRALKEKSELLRYQGDRLAFDMLEVLDNLELAIGHSGADPAKLKSGIELIHKQFVDVLARWEIKALPAVGEVFDPAKHDALSRITSVEHKPGTVVTELKKAYQYKDKLLRHAAVVVSAAPEEGADNTSK